MPGTLLGTWAKSVNKADEDSYFCRYDILVGGHK